MATHIAAAIFSAFVTLRSNTSFSILICEIYLQNYAIVSVEKVLCGIYSNFFTLFYVTSPAVRCRSRMQKKHFLYAFFYPKKPFNPTVLRISICILEEYGWMVWSAKQSQPFIAQLPWKVRLPAYPLRSLRQLFLAKPLKVFPKPVIVFTICAEKVCYKVANICYKLCNAY